MNNIFMITILFLLLLVVITLLYNTIRSNNRLPAIIITPELTDMYITELDKLILYQTVYYIDVKFGENFSKRKAISADIDNSDIYEAAEEIGKTIIELISDNMYAYFDTLYTRNWLYDYINIQVLSMTINYSKLNIQALTKKIFT